MRALIAGGAFLLATLPAMADDGQDCGDLESNLQMTNCTIAQAKAADAELADVFAKVIAAIEATTPDVMPADKVKDWEATMRQAQAEWEKFRDDDCDGNVSYEWWGGSGARLAVAACRRYLTAPALPT